MAEYTVLVRIKDIKKDLRRLEDIVFGCEKRHVNMIFSDQIKLVSQIFISGQHKDAVRIYAAIKNNGYECNMHIVENPENEE